MKKKLFALVLAILMVLSLSACVIGDERVPKDERSLVIDEFENIPGSNCLVYDPNTKVVYFFWTGAYGNRGFGYMSAYYAPNGLPYLYDVETQTLVEIQD